MQIKKSLVSLTLSMLLLFINTAAFALDFSDVSDDHWASKEIESLVERGIISGYPDGTFKPEELVNRAEFTTMLIKALNKQDATFEKVNNFSDIKSCFWAYDDILRSAQEGLVVGYPDRTFKPDQTITKSEATSIISKTVEDFEADSENILEKFVDYKKIAGWAKNSFVKAVTLGLYVNNPDENQLTPNKAMTRAETAVLLYKVAVTLPVKEVKEVTKTPEVVKPAVQVKKAAKARKNVMTTEHLPATPYTGGVNEVLLKGKAATILANNILPVKFEKEFRSSDSAVGNATYLVFDKDLITEEGTTVIPAGSKLLAEVTNIEKGKLFHINGEVSLNVTNLITPNGKIYPLNGKVVNNEILDPQFGKCNLVKGGALGLSVAALGTMIGVIAGSADDVGDGAAIGATAGGGAGLLTAIMAPGCAVNIPASQDVYVKVDNDLNVNLY